MLELIRQADGGGKVPLTETAAALTVETVVDEHATHVEVQGQYVAEVPGGQDTEVGAYLLGRWRVIDTCPAEAGIRTEVPLTVFVVTTEKVQHIEEHIGVEVAHLVFGILEVVARNAGPSGHMFACPVGDVAFPVITCGALAFQSAVHEADTDSRSEPLADSNIQCRGNAVAEVYLLVMVTKIHLPTGTHADEPVVPKTVGFHLILVRTVLHLFFRIGSLCEGRTKSHCAQGGQKDFLSHIQSTVNDLFLYITLGTDSLRKVLMPRIRKFLA